MLSYSSSLLLLCVCLIIFSLIPLTTPANNTRAFQDLHNRANHAFSSSFTPPSQEDLLGVTAHYDLWNEVNKAWTHWAGVGYCRNSTSLLTSIGMPDDVCQRRVCLYSKKHGIYVDLRRLKLYGKVLSERHSESVSETEKEKMLQAISWYSDTSLCHKPKGGQLPANKGGRDREGEGEGDEYHDREGESRSQKRIQLSYIYTLHNNAILSVSSIMEVFRTSHETNNAEYVIIDDGSSEDMSIVYALVCNLQYLFDISITYKRHDVSKGYLLSNNDALRMAKGEYAVLLNSDVLVLPGWLKLLLKTMHSWGERDGVKVGMVGPMMLDSVGRIMEAGGGLYRYGVPFNIARGRHPLSLPLQETRIVDYISAACVLVRRKLFLSLGLYDERYLPAYYEDTDAAMVHADNGYVTLLVPMSVVLHYEGSSYGQTSETNRDSIAGGLEVEGERVGLTVKDKLMNDNAKKFSLRHRHRLSQYCPAPVDCPDRVSILQQVEVSTTTTPSLSISRSPYTFSLSSTANHLLLHITHSFYRYSGLRLLYLEDIVPEPDRDAGSIRLYAMLNILMELGFHVTFESQPIGGRSVKYLLPLWASGVSAVSPGTLHEMAESVRALQRQREMLDWLEEREKARESSKYPNRSATFSPPTPLTMALALATKAASSHLPTFISDYMSSNVMSKDKEVGKRETEREKETSTLSISMLKSLSLSSYLSPNTTTTSHTTSLSLCPYDVIIIARRDVYNRHINDVKTLCPYTPIIFDTVDVHFIREERMSNISQYDRGIEREKERARDRESVRELERDYRNTFGKVKTNPRMMKDVLRERESIKAKLKVLREKIKKDSLSPEDVERERIAMREKELSFMRMSQVTLVVSDEEERVLNAIFEEEEREKGGRGARIRQAKGEREREGERGGTEYVWEESESKEGERDGENKRESRDRKPVDIRVISNIYRVSSNSEDEQGRERGRGRRERGSRRDREGEREGSSVKGRSGAIFVGNMCHGPNVDAVDFIVKHILSPSLSPSLPSDFRMHFVWSRSTMCPSDILTHAAQHPLVVIHRDISNNDLLSLHQQVAVVLAPLRYGAGVKGKVNYALLHGVPVIASRIAAEGMGLVHESNFLQAETGEEFVRAIVRLSQEEELVDRLVRGGKDVMRRLFGRDVAKERLKRVMEDLGVLPRGEEEKEKGVNAFVCPFLSEYDRANGMEREGSVVNAFSGGSYWRTETVKWIERVEGSGEEVEREKEVVFPLAPRLAFHRNYLSYV